MSNKNTSKNTSFLELNVYNIYQTFFILYLYTNISNFITFIDIIC